MGLPTPANHDPPPGPPEESGIYPAETSSPGGARWPGSRRVWQPCPRVSDPSSHWRCGVFLGASGTEGHGAQGAGDGHGCAGSSPLGTAVLSRPQRWPCWADLGPTCWRPLRSHSCAPCTRGHLDRSSLPFGQGRGALSRSRRDAHSAGPRGPARVPTRPEDG